MSTPMGETAQGGSGDTPTATQEKGGRNDAHAFFTAVSYTHLTLPTIYSV